MPYDVEVYHRKADMLAPPELKKVHPLGKSPVVTVTPPGATEPIVLAESGFIFQYLCDHFSQNKKGIVPTRWKEGQDGKVGGETEAWLRYQYLLYYAEGSFMPNFVQYLILSGMLLHCAPHHLLSCVSVLTLVVVLKTPQVPFLVRPISTVIANKVISSFIFPNIKTHLGFLEQQLATSGGDYLTGSDLTAADIQLSYPLVGALPELEKAGKWEKGTMRATYPKLFGYIERLEKSPGWTRAVEKTKEMDGGKFGLVPRPE